MIAESVNGDQKAGSGGRTSALVQGSGGRTTAPFVTSPSDPGNYCLHGNGVSVLAGGLPMW